MADEQHGDALGLDLADDGEQAVDLAAGQRGGRLVHDQETRVAHPRAGDGDDLAVGGGQGSDRGVEIDGDVEPGQRLGAEFATALGVDEGLAFAEQPVEGEVLGHRQAGEQREVLVDDLNAGGDGGARAEVGDGGAVDQKLAFVEVVDAGDDLDEGGFSGAVLAGKADDFGGEDLEVDAVERLHARKALCDGAEFNQGGGHGVRFDFRTGTTFGMDDVASDRDGRPDGPPRRSVIVTQGMGNGGLAAAPHIVRQKL